jgi:hypothetical protein
MDSSSRMDFDPTTPLASPAVAAGTDRGSLISSVCSS